MVTISLFVVNYYLNFKNEGMKAQKQILESALTDLKITTPICTC